MKISDQMSRHLNPDAQLICSLNYIQYMRFREMQLVNCRSENRIRDNPIKDKPRGLRNVCNSLD